MLKVLRMQLTIICSSITSLILLIICILSLQVSESQLEGRNQLAFENHLNTISYQLQSHLVLKTSWLATLEVEHKLVISIHDNGHPLFFKGSWVPLTDRDSLVAYAQQVAYDTYAFDTSLPPPSSLNLPKLIFELKGSQGEPYRVGIMNIPASQGFYSVILLQDIQEEQSSMLHMRLLFIFISLLGVILLALFSFWFAGRAILPIEENSRKQVQFIAAASHELKSPLAVIQSSNACIQHHEGDTHLFTSQIQKECSRMTRLVNDLLLLATADANTWSIHKELTELDTLLIDMLDTFLPLANKKKQRLTLELPDEPIPPLLCDDERIGQAIAILLDNALHYSPEGCTILLTIRLEKDNLLLQVIDHGPGIPKEHLPHIFDRFYRIDTSRKDKNHYGLGLSIAKEIITLHQGSITVKETLGGGCTFSIFLPLQA